MLRGGEGVDMAKRFPLWITGSFPLGPIAPEVALERIAGDLARHELPVVRGGGAELEFHVPMMHVRLLPVALRGLDVGRITVEGPAGGEVVHFAASLKRVLIVAVAVVVYLVVASRWAMLWPARGLLPLVVFVFAFLVVGNYLAVRFLFPRFLARTIRGG